MPHELISHPDKVPPGNLPAGGSCMPEPQRDGTRPRAAWQSAARFRTLGSVTCSRCGLRKAGAACGLCLLCASGMIGAGPDSPIAVANLHRPGVTALAGDHAEQPHIPELAGTQLASQETGIIERHVLTLDHPRYGALAWSSYLG